MAMYLQISGILSLPWYLLLPTGIYINAKKEKTTIWWVYLCAMLHYFHMRSRFHCILITDGTQDSLRETPAVIYYGLITACLPSRKAFNKKKWL